MKNVWRLRGDLSARRRQHRRTHSARKALHLVDGTPATRARPRSAGGCCWTARPGANRESARPVPRRSACGSRWSSRECMISVGQDTCVAPRRARRCGANSSRNRTAFSGEVVRRCNWSNAAQSARVPSGRNCAANTCRNAGSSRPQPTRARSRSSAAARFSSSLTARTARPRA